MICQGCNFHFDSRRYKETRSDRNKDNVYKCIRITFPRESKAFLIYLIHWNIFFIYFIYLYTLCYDSKAEMVFIHPHSLPLFQFLSLKGINCRHGISSSSFFFFSLKIHRNSFSLTKPSSITTSNLDLESICSYDRTYTLSQQISLPLFLSCRVNHKTHSSMTSKIDPLPGVSWKSLSFIL